MGHKRLLGHFIWRLNVAKIRGITKCLVLFVAHKYDFHVGYSNMFYGCFVITATWRFRGWVAAANPAETPTDRHLCTRDVKGPLWAWSRAFDLRRERNDRLVIETTRYHLEGVIGLPNRALNFLLVKIILWAILRIHESLFLTTEYDCSGYFFLFLSSCISKEKSLKKSFILKMSRTFILHDNNVKNLFTNGFKKIIYWIFLDCFKSFFLF